MSLSSASRALQLIVRLMDARNTTEPMIDWGPQKPEIPLNRVSTPLPKDTPERHGIPSRHIAAFLQALFDTFCQQILNLPIDRAEVIFCPGGNGVI